MSDINTKVYDEIENTTSIKSKKEQKRRYNAEYAKKYRERLKKENPEKLRKIDRESMRQQRKNNGDNLRAYQREYMRKYRRNVQGMIPNGDPRHSELFIVETLNEIECKLQYNTYKVKHKQKSKSIERRRLLSRKCYWTKKLKEIQNVKK